MDLTQQDVDLYKRLCSNCISSGLEDAIDSKEKAITSEIKNLNNKISNIFGELMNEDCLNTAEPD